MITFCVNEHPTPDGFVSGQRPQLLFICKADGAAAAIPRVMHQHEDRFELMFIMQGSGIYNIDGRRYPVTRGDLLVFNSGVLHDEHPQASDDLLIFSCGVEQLNIDGLPLNHLTPCAQPAVVSAGDSYDEICQLFFRMWQHVSSKSRFSGEVGNSLLQALLLICRNLWSESQTHQETTTAALGQKIKDYIDAHYKQEFTFEAITSSLNMNRFYLAHVFKDFSGYSPKQYQTRRRIGEAQSLLLSTSMGVTEVAHAVGYDNVNNFHRIFQNLVGIPPARYKKFWLTGQLKGPDPYPGPR